MSSSLRLDLRAFVVLSFAAHVAVAGALARRPSAGATEVDPTAARPTLAGDTLEVPGLETLTEESAVDLDSEPEPLAPSPAVAPGPAPKRASARPKLVVRGGAATPTSAGEHGGDAEPARFGAVGERGAVDLATAVTRGFPQAASADPVWQKAAFGAAGSIDLVLTLDDTGHLVEARLEGDATPALRQALTRTVALVRGRTFTARRATTRLHVVGRVSADAVRDESRADVFAIGGSYVGRSGSAFFSLSSGRRIDVTVTER
ncbi:MAG: hypothetical protein U0235_04335 [Polyangiaceae bacterium]